MKTLRKTFLLIALSCFLLLAGLFLYSGVAFMALYYPGAIPFEKKGWAEAEDFGVDRLRMLRSLFAQYNLVGMSKSEVMGLLGSGYSTIWAKGGVYDENSMNYVLGDTDCNEDPWWLCLKLSDGRVWSFRSDQARVTHD